MLVDSIKCLSGPCGLSDLWAAPCAVLPCENDALAVIRAIFDALQRATQSVNSEMVPRGTRDIGVCGK